MKKTGFSRFTLLAAILTLLLMVFIPVAEATTYSDNIVPGSGGTAGAGSRGQYAGLAFDGNYGTYWEVHFYDTNRDLWYVFPTPRIVTRTKLVQADPEAHVWLPCDWVFLGSNDGVNWDVLGTTNVGITENSFTDNVNNSTAYTMYKFANFFWDYTDEWGGIAEVEMFETIDETAPTTTATPNGTQGNNGWFRSDVQVNLSATDNIGGSGVAQTVYSFDQNTWTEYTGPFTVSTEGSNPLYYKSKDNAGNWENIKTVTFNIDKTLPTIKLRYAQGTSVITINPLLPIKFIADDSISGLVTGPEISWSDDNTNPTGQAVINISAEDAAGNIVTRVLNFSWLPE